MINAAIAREISNTIRTIRAEEHLLKIMHKVAEEMIDPRCRCYIFSDIETKDINVIKHIEDRLIQLGYRVETSIDSEYSMADFTVRW